MLNIYRYGQKVRCSVTFEVNDVATDPTAVTFKVRTPARTTTTYTYGAPDAVIVKDATGQYHADVTANAMGEWNFRFEGTGACQAVEESAFVVYGEFSA
jgi:hypothetical protein